MRGAGLLSFAQLSLEAQYFSLYKAHIFYWDIDHKIEYYIHFVAHKVTSKII